MKINSHELHDPVKWQPKLAVICKRTGEIGDDVMCIGEPEAQSQGPRAQVFSLWLGTIES